MVAYSTFVHTTRQIRRTRPWSSLAPVNGGEVRGQRENERVNPEGSASA